MDNKERQDRLIMNASVLRRVNGAPYNGPMLVRDLGEFELIALLESRIRERNRVQIENLRPLGVEVEIRKVRAPIRLWNHA